MVKPKNGNGHKNGHHRPTPAQMRIDRTQFEDYCRRQYTNVGIAAEFGVSIDTLARWVEVTYGRPSTEVTEEKRELGHNTIRSVLFTKAEQGQPWAVIWYSKNYMGMAERVEETVRPGAPVEEPQIWATADGRRIVFRP